MRVPSLLPEVLGASMLRSLPETISGATSQLFTVHSARAFSSPRAANTGWGDRRERPHAVCHSFKGKEGTEQYLGAPSLPRNSLPSSSATQCPSPQGSSHLFHRARWGQHLSLRVCVQSILFSCDFSNKDIFGNWGGCVYLFCLFA